MRIIPLIILSTNLEMNPLLICAALPSGKSKAVKLGVTVSDAIRDKAIVIATVIINSPKSREVKPDISRKGRNNAIKVKVAVNMAPDT